jgi:3-hydroxyisobutyrate dehydrogenase
MVASGTGTGPDRVGFVGAGQMGRPMVDRMVAAGIPVTVYARRAEHRDELGAAGIATADSPVALAGDVDVVIVCLYHDDQVRSLMIDDGVLAAMRPGSVLVSHVTGSPAVPRDLQAAAPAGVTVLDVPISGTADHIRRGELTLMVGGDVSALERVEPVFATYCDPILHVGRLGDGQRVKLLNNLVFTVNLQTALRAAALGESMGVPVAELARVLGECSGGSFAIDLLRHADPATLTTAARPYLVKDVSTIREVAAEQGIDLGPLGRLAEWVFEPVGGAS